MTPLHLVPLSEIEAEVHRRRSRTPEDAVLRRLTDGWQAPGQIARQAEISRTAAIHALQLRCAEGKAQFARKGNSRAYRRAR
jgi:hypothetical protein